MRSLRLFFVLASIALVIAGFINGLPLVIAGLGLFVITIFLMVKGSKNIGS